MQFLISFAKILAIQVWLNFWIILDYISAIFLPLFGRFTAIFKRFLATFRPFFGHFSVTFRPLFRHNYYSVLQRKENRNNPIFGYRNFDETTEPLNLYF